MPSTRFVPKPDETCAGHAALAYHMEDADAPFAYGPCIWCGAGKCKFWQRPDTPPEAPADRAYHPDETTWQTWQMRLRPGQSPPATVVDGTFYIGSNKPPLEYLGDVTLALNALALQLEFGATRPGRKRGCWRQVYAEPEKRQEVFGKVLRHVLAAMSGEVLDEHQRPNLVAAMTNLVILVELQASSAPKEGA